MNEGIDQQLDQYAPLMTSDEVAEVLRCSAKHVTEAILPNNPELECKVSQGKRLTIREELRDWVKSGGENGNREKEKST